MYNKNEEPLAVKNQHTTIAVCLTAHFFGKLKRIKPSQVMLVN
jgi:hypothetical protein